MARKTGTASTLRWSDEQKEKMRLIAEAHRRSLNRELEVAIAEYIADYENKNGRIDVELGPQQLSLFK
ncbi:MAG: Arc family DNA-binding protein [Schwartzia sp.]|nr:Arc family DNA-binding protein [Schwartzia sp. (in: firmicutes)]